MKSSTLRIEGIECYAHHGCLPEETRIGSNFSVDVIMEIDLQKAMETDDLQYTADYVKVHDIVHEEMDIPSKIIEHVGGRILNRIASSFSVINATVRITKFNPPVNGRIARAVAEISLK